MKYLSRRIDVSMLVARTARSGINGRLISSLAAIVVVAFARRFERVEVTGRSMEPTLSPGDRLLVWRTRRVRVGQLVVVDDPRDAGPPWIKRVFAIGADGVDVRGDRPEASTDSRHVGPVPWQSVRGRVVRRYAVRPS